MCNPVARKENSSTPLSSPASTPAGGTDSASAHSANMKIGENKDETSKAFRLVVDNKHAMDHIRDYDVLMGRGSGPNRHSGNIHFRAIVGEVFDDFLRKNAATPNVMRARSGMLRIDPATKNRLAQTVLDKISVEKNGRFLQKLNKKELMDAIEKGQETKLIKARANSIMDATLTTPILDSHGGIPGDTSMTPVNAVVFYKLIPEKQILAKIKQTFRFLRDQNEASKTDKHRQRARQAAAVAASLNTMNKTKSPTDSFNSVCNLPNQGGLSKNSTIAATMALMGMNNTQLPDALKGGNSVNPSLLAGTPWAATRNPSNIAGIPPSSLMSMNALKNSPGSMDYSQMASRLLCDLPQPQRILSANDNPGTPPSSLLQGSSLVAAVSQQLEKNPNLGATMDVNTKRLIEELTLSRLANLQRQREDTINTYLAMERSSNLPSSSPNNVTSAMQIQHLLNSTAASNMHYQASGTASEQIQRILNTTAAPNMPNQYRTSGVLPISSSEPLSLLRRMSNNNKNGGDNLTRFSSH